MAEKLIKPRLIMFAGPNGSGKSSITPVFQNQPDFPKKYINPDEIALTLGGNTMEKAYQASAIAAQKRLKCINDKQSFSFETVMSHPSKLAILETAKQAGFETRIVFISTNNPLTNVERVKERVRDGKHDVPEDKVISRYHRTLSLLPRAAEIAHSTFIFDNSFSSPKLETVLSQGKVIEQPGETIKWVENIIKTLDERQQERLEIEQKNLDNLIAPLDKSEYLGKIESVSKHFVVQQTKNGQTVIHENSILNFDESVQGRDVTISYRNGVHNINILEEQIREQPVDTSQALGDVLFNLASSAKYIALNSSTQEISSNNQKVYNFPNGLVIEQNFHDLSIFYGDKSIQFDQDFNLVKNDFSDREIHQLNQKTQQIKQQKLEQNRKEQNQQDRGLSL
jgi:predicted ABC-type ATPase